MRSARMRARYLREEVNAAKLPGQGFWLYAYKIQNKYMCDAVCFLAPR